MRARLLVLAVLLLSYGAVGARQPAVRMSVALPATTQQIADALDMDSSDRGQFALKIIRTIFATGAPVTDVNPRLKLQELVTGVRAVKGELVPLPLDASIWRETIFQRQVPDDQIMAAIFADRSFAMLYHGLAGLDDETLAWLGPEREILQHLLRHAGAFAVLGPSVRVRQGKIAVPGGDEAAPLWQAIVGADPSKPGAFVRKLFGDDDQGARFYDAIAQLDEPHRKFALGHGGTVESRIDRVRALADGFKRGASEWRPEVLPFTRRPVDPALTVSIVAVDENGALVGPSSRSFWNHIFFGEGPASALAAGSNSTAIDAAGLLSYIHRAPVDVARRRLETFLFAQRVFPSSSAHDPIVASVVRAYMEMPALMLTLERMGVKTPATMQSAALRAAALNNIGNGGKQRIATLEFQSLIGMLDRMRRSGGLSVRDAETLVSSLTAIETTNDGYQGRLAAWIRGTLAPALPRAPRETPDALEDAVVAAMAGMADMSSTSGPVPSPKTIEWEGHRYRVSAPDAEATRIRRVRQHQRGLSLTAALAQLEAGPQKGGGDRQDSVLAETLTSIHYAAYLGDPEGPALVTGNVALKHDLDSNESPRGHGAWRVPSEGQGSEGWRVSGSLLGLDIALARMALRRLDANVMPPEPKLVSAERHTASLSVALLNAVDLNDATRDEISSALGRGRARIAALGDTRADIDAVAADAGLSPWRREALAWTAVNNREDLPSQFSLVETMWLGKPRSTPALDLDRWGAAVMPLNGCVCLAMPPARSWEPLTGRPSLGLLATRGADVTILVADMLAELKLPAEIAPGVVAYAMQDVIDQTRPAHFDDWLEFTRATTRLTRDTLIDFIAAQTAGGALLPARASDDRN